MTHSDLKDLPKIVRERLLSLGVQSGDRCVVALSGGQDSTALLLATLEGWGRGDLTAAAHLDHAVRDGSDGEQRIVISLCNRLGVELRTGRLDREKVMQTARREGSLEAALRIYRYEFLMSCVVSMGATWLLTGHTADDQVETVLFRVMRGMDPMALSGIPEKRAGIIRPLLGISREIASRYCLEMGVKPLFDPSNEDMRFARNKIRYQTIPALKDTFHPLLEKHVLRLSSLVRRMEKVEDILLYRLDSRISEHDKDGFMIHHYSDLPDVLRGPAVRRFLHSGTGSWPSRSLVREALEHLYGGKKGRMSLPKGKTMDSSGRETYIYSCAENERLCIPAENTRLPIPGRVRFETAGVAISSEYGMLEDPDRFPAGDTVLIAKKGLLEPLWVRRRHPGDRFIPLGMTGAKKMKDFFIDRKIPRHERDNIPLVTDNVGEILWVAGVEISQKAALDGYKGEEMVVLRMERYINSKWLDSGSGPDV